MRSVREIWVAHDADEVLLWHSPGASSQRVMRLHGSARTLLRALAEEGDKPTALEAIWLERRGFDELLAMAVLDPASIAAEKGRPNKPLAAQHRLATRYALVRLALELERDSQEGAGARTVPCLRVSPSAREMLHRWTVRKDSVRARALTTGQLAKALHPRAYPVDPASLCSWCEG